MIETSRICIGISLILITLTLIFHIVAMGYPRWKAYEHRLMHDRTIFIGIFDRCENRLINVTSTFNKIYPICDTNKYYFNDDTSCALNDNKFSNNDIHYSCNLPNNPCNCDYSSITKGLIACTIISACVLGISLLLIFSHILINQYQYKIHRYISFTTIPLLFLGFIFILITLILLGSTMSYDLYQYRYNLDRRLATGQSGSTGNNNIRMNVTQTAERDYVTRLEWASGLEIIALILSGFTLITQIIYLLSIYRNRIG